MTDLLAPLVSGPGVIPGPGTAAAPMPLPAYDDYEPTPIDLWLRRQQDLSAVERFSAHHDAAGNHGVDVRLGVARYRDRLPASPPGPGQQYAFDVDLDACTGCKACVAACHSLNGLADDEHWRRVGALHPTDGRGTDARGSVTVTSACHHCVDPACLQGCPANAYEKDPVTGIVRHLDDACIGCSYCTLTCPYEVPTFQPALGIVRKCDMCSDRLADGEAPACVQGCPQGAITITVVTTDEVLAASRGDVPTTLVPSAPDSALTVPSTRYRSSSPIPDSWVAADRSSVHPSHGHAPLAVMLVLTQFAVGLTVAAVLTSATGDLSGSATDALALTGLATGLLALAASTLHLGRPLLAWRAVLGLRRSWLSREIATFGLFAGAGAARTGLELLDAPQPLVVVATAAWVVGGLAGVACSAQLYAVTGRRWWRLAVTGPRFVGTMVTGGTLGAAAIVALTDPPQAADLVHLFALLGLVGLFVSVTAPIVPLAIDRCRRQRSTELAGTARLLRHDLRNRHLVRLATAGVAVFLIVGALAGAGQLGHGSHEPGVALAVAAVLALIGEHQDRRLFFLASVAPRMPGSPT